MPKIRLDILMVECCLVGSRALAQRLVLAGQVLVDGAPAFKPGTKHILCSLNTELILAFQGETAEKSIDNPCYTNKRKNLFFTSAIGYC